MEVVTGIDRGRRSSVLVIIIAHLYSVGCVAHSFHSLATIYKQQKKEARNTMTIWADGIE